MVSGRPSYEIVQKAALASIPLIAAVSAPSSLAIAMANDLGIETVAECVENELTRDKLLGMEIDYAQGFYFGKPQPLRTLFTDGM